MLIGHNKKDFKTRVAYIQNNLHGRYRSKEQLRCELSERQHGRCVVCGENLPSDEPRVQRYKGDNWRPTVVGHMIPVRVWAGTALPIEEAARHANSKENLALICSACNSRMGCLEADDFLVNGFVKPTIKQPRNVLAAITVQIDPADKDRLEKIKTATGQTVSQTVCQIVREFFAQKMNGNEQSADGYTIEPATVRRTTKKVGKIY